MFKIGVDATNINRFINKKTSFINRVLSTHELAEYNQITDQNLKAKFLARAWAIKESIYKIDNSYIDFRNIDLVKKNNIWEFKNFCISITYVDNLVISVAISKEKNEKI
ncbi:4'-phosphopantetheinyl transferase superfamily protein [Mycoplasma sp. 2045]|uniref:4'-phosphopantetheinyl transferase family protein n=1 Tax=unclassified Mycoplasma TaxID=2683645 RepID=UPI00211CF767|nr:MULTISPECIES: 4'-phosphopantetheinyl transferase superfamily protein [unclassified Mycoplasma]MEA4191134.1 4'-phosphopantetheinyl transferase superfamily protein [Mycoplasma sp. 2248]MEA4206259.1 4'-phosphopantetheinyl transferase superfamily protein [Mycoplasma sp. 1199]MEA4333636.1 4'-phosphopantetheinyl transferase superfamily protein [Mycoplasma sp. 1232]UUM20592.1 4'-phosphopantetheinyl transferase superfamily protein [Mycoplasma sp. 2045]